MTNNSSLYSGSSWKQWGDIIVVLITLPLWGTFFLLLWLLLRATKGSPVLISAPCLGQHGKTIHLLCFAITGKDKTGSPGTNSCIERFLLYTGLVHLPCILNIFSSDISLVGPKPFAKKDLPLPEDELLASSRFTILPGLTGWGQVQAKPLSVRQTLVLDEWYVDNANPLLDVLILLKAFWLKTFGAFFK